jgi:hypothetical protein
MQRHEQCGLQAFAAAGDADERVDVLGPDLERLVGARHPHQVLPGERHSIARIEAAGEAELGDASAVSRRAAELPRGLPQRNRNPGLGLELLDVGLAGAIGVRLGQRELRVERQGGRRRRGS